MTREEYFASVQAYKKGTTIPKQFENWKENNFDQAVGLLAKMAIAHGMDIQDDAEEFENQFNILMHGMPVVDDRTLNNFLEELEETTDNFMDSLEHGGEWKKHKYIRIENGRYIYPEDLKKSTYKKIQTSKETAQKKLDEIEGNTYVKAGKSGTNVLTGEPMTGKEPKTGLANLDMAKRVNEKKHDMTLSGDNQGIPTRFYTYNKAGLDGVTKTANELQKQINKADLDKKNLDELHKNAENLVQKNEDRKERNYQAVGKAGEEARSHSDSAAKAQAEGEAMQAWKNAQAVRAKDNNSKNQAQSEGEAQQKWKNDQAAKKRFEEAEAKTIDRIAELQSGAKENYDNELKILKRAVTEDSVNSEKNKKIIEENESKIKETLKNQEGSNNSKNQAQSEGEAMQAWKDAKAIKGNTVTKKTSVGPVSSYVSNNKKAVDIYEKIKDDSLHGSKRSMKDLYGEMTQDVDEDTAYEILKMILPGASKEYYDEMYFNTRKNNFKHSLNTREDFYAAIQQYKSNAVFQ